MPPWNDHFECGDCHRAFPAGWLARNQHCKATGHGRPNFECDKCHYLFHNEEDQRKHEIDDHLWCGPCTREFRSSNNIQQHLRSGVHVGSNITCPWCKGGFATAAGVTAHLENGGCPNIKLNRQQIYDFVRAKDPHGFLSKNLIEYHGHETWTASDESYNGKQHLNSPVHRPEVYHCPNRQCAHDFKSLASTANHLESESCGFMSFKAVQDMFPTMTTSRLMLAF
ncbi:uncharacterized protein EHS24_004622 [Apiotrichum porosum]|uniref:C2H2-type domain-containing protein n=1 Tax=Apiotrichum porosum TaxID=105984 RepID=A0A427Y5N0_9TREE|nr:uncharacterized protein EHS24_004622 [Apiotrichum porosum]RSH86372.1 hypothetical protein EHS24_004622 [Apiotrichum porosum]